VHPRAELVSDGELSAEAGRGRAREAGDGRRHADVDELGAELHEQRRAPPRERVRADIGRERDHALVVDDDERGGPSDGEAVGEGPVVADAVDAALAEHLEVDRVRRLEPCGAFGRRVLRRGRDAACEPRRGRDEAKEDWRQPHRPRDVRQRDHRRLSPPLRSRLGQLDHGMSSSRADPRFMGSTVIAFIPGLPLGARSRCHRAAPERRPVDSGRHRLDYCFGSSSAGFTSSVPDFML